MEREPLDETLVAEQIAAMQQAEQLAQPLPAPEESGVQVPLGFGRPIFEAVFRARPNRFLVEAELDGQIVFCHLADRGRLLETLVPGARLLLAHNDAPGRKTQYQAVAAYRNGALTSLDTHLPNRLIEAALRARALPPFAHYAEIRREVALHPRPVAVAGARKPPPASRFDFQLRDGAYRCTVEVKSAGFVADGVALFPDAPTERGRRHLGELAELARQGERAAVVFVAQGAAQAVAMNTAIDPLFAAALREAAASALEIYAYACPLSWQGIALGPEIPVLLEG